jgi:hypothetical protein
MTSPKKIIKDRMRRFENQGRPYGAALQRHHRQFAVSQARQRRPRADRRRQIVLAEKNRQKLVAQLHHLHSQKLESLGMLAGGEAHERNNTLVPVLALTKITQRRLPEGSRERATSTPSAGRRSGRAISCGRS